MTVLSNVIASALPDAKRLSEAEPLWVRVAGSDATEFVKYGAAVYQNGPSVVSTHAIGTQDREITLELIDSYHNRNSGGMKFFLAYKAASNIDGLHVFHDGTSWRLRRFITYLITISDAAFNQGNVRRKVIMRSEGGNVTLSVYDESDVLIGSQTVNSALDTYTGALPACIYDGSSYSVGDAVTQDGVGYMSIKVDDLSPGGSEEIEGDILVSIPTPSIESTGTRINPIEGQGEIGTTSPNLSVGGQTTDMVSGNISIQTPFPQIISEGVYIAPEEPEEPEPGIVYGSVSFPAPFPGTVVDGTTVTTIGGVGSIEINTPIISTTGESLDLVNGVVDIRPVVSSVDSMGEFINSVLGSVELSITNPVVYSIGEVLIQIIGVLETQNDIPSTRLVGFVKDAMGSTAGSVPKFNYNSFKNIVARIMSQFGSTANIVSKDRGSYDVETGAYNYIEKTIPAQVLFTSFEKDESINGVIPTPQHTKIIINTDGGEPRNGDTLVHSISGNSYRIDGTKKISPDGETIIIYIVMGMRIVQ